MFGFQFMAEVFRKKDSAIKFTSLKLIDLNERQIIIKLKFEMQINSEISKMMSRFSKLKNIDE